MFSANANGVIRHVLFPVVTCDPVTSAATRSGPRDVMKGNVKSTRKTGVSQGGTRVVILPATSRTPQRSMICRPIRDFPVSRATTASERSATWTPMAFNWTPPCYVTSGRSVTVLASSRSLPPACRSTAVVQRATRSTPAAVAAPKARRKSSFRPKPKFLKGKPRATPVAPVVKDQSGVVRGQPQSGCPLIVPRFVPHPAVFEHRVLCPKQNLFGSKVPTVVNSTERSVAAAPHLCDRGDILRGDDMQVRIAHRVAMEMRLGLPSAGALWNIRKVHCGGDDDSLVAWTEPRMGRGDMQAESRTTMVVSESTSARTAAGKGTVATPVSHGTLRLKTTPEVRQQWNRKMQRLPIRGARSVSSVITRLVEQRETRLSSANPIDARLPGAVAASTDTNRRKSCCVNIPAGSATATPTETRPVCSENDTGSNGSGTTNLRRASLLATAATKRKTTT